MNKIYALVLSMFLLSGCALIQDEDRRLQLTVQYTTMKVIENSDDISAQRVVENVRRVRGVLDVQSEVTVTRLMEEVRGNVRWDRLDAADQLLLSAVLEEVEKEMLDRVGEGVVEEEDKIVLRTLLDWVEGAARLL